jgi:NitT/TauT family transport system permease protein
MAGYKPGFNWVKLKKQVFSLTTFRGILAIIVFTVLWEICSRLQVPIVGNVPPPSSVLKALGQQLVSKSYWASWGDSFIRILTGFAIAQVVGIPLGLLLGVKKTAREIIYPVFEIMRPIPPLA